MDNIKQFPEFVPLGLEHREIISEYFSREKPEISEFNFTELFAWRLSGNIKIACVNEGICFYFLKKGVEYLAPPVGLQDFAGACGKMLREYPSRNIFFRAFPRDKTAVLPDKFIIEDDRDNYDYIYLAEEMINLKGRKFDKKRNSINKFERENTYEFVEINSSNIAEIIEFQEKWCALKPCEDDMSLRDENAAVKEILKNYFKLSVIGAAVKIGGEVKAFTIASEMNPEMAAVIVEKADHRYKGIYQAINRMFADKYLSKYKWINRQQDTGDPGLRKAKLSYKPARMIEKKIVKLKQGQE